MANLSPSDPLVLQAKHAYALAMADLDELAQAAGLLREAFEGRQIQLGPSHPDTLASRFALASIRACSAARLSSRKRIAAGKLGS